MWEYVVLNRCRPLNLYQCDSKHDPCIWGTFCSWFSVRTLHSTLATFERLQLTSRSYHQLIHSYQFHIVSRKTWTARRSCMRSTPLGNWSRSCPYSTLARRKIGRAETLQINSSIFKDKFWWFFVTLLRIRKCSKTSRRVGNGMWQRNDFVS